MAAAKLERLKLLMGDEDLPLGTDPEPEEEDVEEIVRETATEEVPTESKIEFDPADQDMFYGEDYRDDNIIPAFDSSDEGPRNVSRWQPKVSGHRKSHRQKEQKVTGLLPLNGHVDPTHHHTSSSARLDGKVGQMALPEQVFCPIQAVAKYPYRYINKEAEEPIAQKFFAGGRFYERNWDVYYIYPPQSIATKPLFFVPADQVYTLIRDINKTFGCKLGFPANSIESGFEMSFPEEHIPRPRYLGKCNSQAELKELERRIPSTSFKPDREEPETGQASDKSLNAFKKKLELALEIAKNRNKASKAKKRDQRIDRQQGWVKELKKTKRFLGLRPEQAPFTAPIALDDHQLWDDTKSNTRDWSPSYVSGTPIDEDASAPFPFDQSVVFICVDVEAFERNHNIVTEIGIATLDTNDLIGVPPGEDGKAWMSKIRSRHLRISDNAHLQNKEFVDGCADKFEFGKSEWVTLKDAPRAVASCFRPPFSAPRPSTQNNHETNSSAVSDQTASTKEQPRDSEITDPIDALKDDVAKVNINDHDEISLYEADETDKEEDDEEEPQEDDTEAATPARRNIVLVGHDVSIDVGYLQKIGYNPHNLSNLIQVIDTANLYRAWKRDSTTRSLATILYDLDLVGWNFHNAGNDAVYTLQAMIGLAIRALTRRPREEVKRERLDRAREALKVAAEKIWDEGEGWSDADDAGGVLTGKENRT